MLVHHVGSQDVLAASDDGGSAVQQRVNESEGAAALRMNDQCPVFHLGEVGRAWARASGEVEMQVRVYDLACRVALSQGAHVEAAAQVLAGERLVVATGAGLFRDRLAALRLMAVATTMA